MTVIARRFLFSVVMIRSVPLLLTPHCRSKVAFPRATNVLRSLHGAVFCRTTPHTLAAKPARAMTPIREEAAYGVPHGNDTAILGCLPTPNTSCPLANYFSLWHTELEPGDVIGVPSAPLLQVALAAHETAQSPRPSEPTADAADVFTANTDGVDAPPQASPPPPALVSDTLPADPPTELQRLSEASRRSFLRMWDKLLPHLRPFCEGDIYILTEINEVARAPKLAKEYVMIDRRLAAGVGRVAKISIDGAVSVVSESAPHTGHQL